MSTVELRTLYIQEPPYMNTLMWMHLEKNRTYECTFPVQRKEINVVKVRFTMRYSSRKLSNDKVITTACNFWRQIACSVQVISRNMIFLGKKIFEIPPFFSDPARGSGQKSSRMLITFFRPERETLVGFGHVSPRIWEITNKQFGGGADKCEICLYKA